MKGFLKKVLLIALLGITSLLLNVFLRIVDHRMLSQGESESVVPEAHAEDAGSVGSSGEAGTAGTSGSTSASASGGGGTAGSGGS